MNWMWEYLLDCLLPSRITLCCIWSFLDLLSLEEEWHILQPISGYCFHEVYACIMLVVVVEKVLFCFVIYFDFSCCWKLIHLCEFSWSIGWLSTTLQEKRINLLPFLWLLCISIHYNDECVVSRADELLGIVTWNRGSNVRLIQGEHKFCLTCLYYKCCLYLPSTIQISGSQNLWRKCLFGVLQIANLMTYFKGILLQNW